MQFQGRRFPCSQFIPVGPFYSDVGPQDRQCVSSSAGPGEAFVDGEIYLSTNFGYHRQHLWRLVYQLLLLHPRHAESGEETSASSSPWALGFVSSIS